MNSKNKTLNYSYRNVLFTTMLLSIIALSSTLYFLLLMLLQLEFLKLKQLLVRIQTMRTSHQELLRVFSNLLY